MEGAVIKYVLSLMHLSAEVLCNFVFDIKSAYKNKNRFINT